MRGLKTDPTAPIVIRGHAFIHNLRRSHYELDDRTTQQRLGGSLVFVGALGGSAVLPVR